MTTEMTISQEVREAIALEVEAWRDKQTLAVSEKCAELMDSELSNKESLIRQILMFDEMAVHAIDGAVSIIRQKERK